MSCSMPPTPQQNEMVSSWQRERDVYYGVGRRPEKTVKGVVKLREAKATTLRRVLLAFMREGDFLIEGGLGREGERVGREREGRLLLSWAKAGKDSKGRSKATRSEGDDLGDF